MVRNLSLYTSLYTSHFSCTFLCRHVLYCPVCLSRRLFLSKLSLFYTSVLGWNARLDFFCFCRFLYDLFCFRKRPGFFLLSSVLSPSVSASVGLSVSYSFLFRFGYNPHSPVFGIGGGGAVICLRSYDQLQAYFRHFHHTRACIHFSGFRIHDVRSGNLTIAESTAQLIINRLPISDVGSLHFKLPRLFAGWSPQS